MKRLRAEKRKGKGERPGKQVRQKHAKTKKSNLCDAKRGDWRKARISATCRDQQKISTTIHTLIIRAPEKRNPKTADPINVRNYEEHNEKAEAATNA